MAFLIGGANSAADTGFSVANSCRFNDDDSAYLTRSTESPTDVDKYTFSCWIKRGNLGASNCVIFGIQGDNVNAQEILDFNSDDVVWRQTESGGGNTDYDRVTDKKFRDISAWYHIVIAYDSSQGTAGNRCKMYVNGVQETSFSTSNDPSSNLDSIANSNSRTFNLGQVATGGQFFDGYMAEVVFIDGQQLAATSFGEFNSDSPTIWQPIDVSGLTFGNNGFYLDFEDSSALGNDVSGNNNDFTATNLAAIDQCNDSPTNNFCTMNPLENYIPGHTFSEGNNTIATTDASETYTMSTFGVTKGKWYFEALLDGTTYSEFSQIGVASTKGPAAGDYLGDTQTGYGYDNTGNYRKNDDDSIDIVSYGDTFTGGDIIGVYLDLDNSKLYFGKNGTIQNSGTGISITAAASALITGTYFFCVGDRHGDDAIWHCNFGNGSFSETAMSSGNADANGYGNFEYDPSDGGGSSFDSAAKDFLAICTKNLGSDGG